MSRRLFRRVLLLAGVLGLLLEGPAGLAAQSPPPSAPASEPAQVPVVEPCADVPLWQKPACEIREGVQAGVGTVVNAGLTSAVDQLQEWVVGGATWLLDRLVSLLDETTRPNPAAGWFARQYGVMTSLAVALVMPLLLLSTISALLRQDWRGLTRTYVVYLPAAMIATGMAIPLVAAGLEITDWMSELLMGGLRGDVERFLTAVNEALTAGASTPTTTAGAVPGVASFLMFLVAFVIALGALAVWVELVLREVGIYVAVFFLPMGFMAMVWPATRRWCGRLIKAVVALILSKFVIVAVIALAAAALGTDTPGFQEVVAAAAMTLMAAFSPVTLFAVADVAGDELAGAVSSVTQHRTSPVPAPTGRQTAANVYGRIMSTRGSSDGRLAGVGLAGAAVAAGAAGPVGSAVGAAKTAAQAPGQAGRGAGTRLDDAANPGGADTSGAGEGSRVSEQAVLSETSTPQPRPGGASDPAPSGGPPASGPQPSSAPANPSTRGAQEEHAIAPQAPASAPERRPPGLPPTDVSGPDEQR